MSRNLCRTDCAFCGGWVSTTESARPMTERDCDEYRGMRVANAECDRCKAKYLAWMSRPARWPEERRIDFHPGGIVDLSFRSTFNDEPGISDLPVHHITIEATPRKRPFFASDDTWAQHFLRHHRPEVERLRAADLVAADAYLESEPALPTLICPRCDHRFRLPESEQL